MRLTLDVLVLGLLGVGLLIDVFCNTGDGA